MKFYEYGQEKVKTLLLLCGWTVNWLGAKPTINELKKQYHVIVQAYDGFNMDEPKSTFVSVVKEGQYGADYIAKHLNGKIDIIYGVSYGATIATEILLDKRITAHTVIADGFTITEFPDYRKEAVKRLLANLNSKIAYTFMVSHREWIGLVAKVLGRSKEQFEAVVYKEASYESFFNGYYSLIGYRYKYEVFAKTDFHIWQSVEKKSKKKVKRLKEQGYHFTHTIFDDLGHGGFAQQPKRLINEINRAYQQLTYS